jgi:uncharacterized coiled-coil protein SlyX
MNGVSDGQYANETSFNDAFMARNGDTDTVGKVGLLNNDAPSGPHVTNPQGYINELADTDGVASFQDANRKIYSSTNYISNGDNRKTAIEKLDTELLAVNGILTDHETRIGDLETTVADHESRITQNELDIATHETRIDGHDTDISGHETRLDNLETQPMTIGGTKDFENGIKTDAIEEHTLDIGVTIDGVLLKDGLVSGRDIAADGITLDDHETRIDDLELDVANHETRISTIEVSSFTFGGNKTFNDGAIVKSLLNVFGKMNFLAMNNTQSGSDVVLPEPTATVVDLTNVGLVSIAEIDATSPPDRQLVIIRNNKAGDVIIKNEANANPGKIFTGSGQDLTLEYKQIVMLMRNNVTGNWTVMSGSGGGGGASVAVYPTVQSITAGGEFTTDILNSFQVIRCQGDTQARVASSTPFGATGGWIDGTLVEVICVDDTNTVSIPYSDTAKGCVGNFSLIELAKYQTAKFRYINAIDRWVYVQ